MYLMLGTENFMWEKLKEYIFIVFFFHVKFVLQY